MKRFAALFALMGLIVSMDAATLSFTGVQTDVEPHSSSSGAGWRHSTTPKTFDVSGDNILGTDGYLMFGIGVSSLPAYVSAITPIGSLYPGNASYASVDNPSSIATDVQTGVVFINTVAANSESDMFSFTLTGTVPGTFAISLMLDSSDVPTLNNGNTLRLRQTTGGSNTSGYSTALSNNNNPDWYTFIVTGGNAGDVFTVSERAPTTGNDLHIGAIAFDTAVPEPASATLLLIGSMAGLALHFRRRNSA